MDHGHRTTPFFTDPADPATRPDEAHLHGAPVRVQVHLINVKVVHLATMDRAELVASQAVLDRLPMYDWTGVPSDAMINDAPSAPKTGPFPSPLSPKKMRAPRVKHHVMSTTTTKGPLILASDKVQDSLEVSFW